MTGPLRLRAQMVAARRVRDAAPTGRRPFGVPVYSRHVTAASKLACVAALTAVVGCFRAERLIAVGRGNDAGTDAGATWGPFGPPQEVVGLRSASDDVQDPSLTGDELELYFSSATGGIKHVWRSKWAGSAWGAAAAVSGLSSTRNEEDPKVSTDGLTIYFASDRAGDGLRLYVARRGARDAPWGTPARLEGLGTSVLDRSPAVDEAQVQMVFASQRGTSTTMHLYATSRTNVDAGWQTADALTTITSAWQDVDPALFGGARYLIFASRRAGQGKTADLFQAVRPEPGSPFASNVEPLTELNTDSSEGDPWLSADGRHILFSSDRRGPNRIYEAWRDGAPAVFLLAH